MSTSIAELQTVFYRMIPVIEDLLTAAYQQTEALKKDDLDRLLAIAQQQQLLAAKLQPLEEKRLQAVEAFSKELGLEIPPVLSELVNNTELPEDFRETAKTLQEKLELLREQNELNNMLLTQSLYYTRKLLNIFSQTATYQPDGTVEQIQVSSALIDKSV